MPASRRADFTGPALFSYGFRPFFLGAALFAAGVIPVWMLIYTGHLDFRAPFPALDWHIHEMLFGYSAAVISGFLFTAIPNWTGRMPLRGWPLAGLAALWLAGRLAVTGAFGLSAIPTMVIDCSFLAAIVAVVLVEIIAGRNWKNLMVVVPVMVLFLANILFHIEVLLSGQSDYSRRLGFAVVVFLIMLIGGRIIPSFTRNWLVKNNPGPLPVPMNRNDGLCLAVGAATVLIWVAVPGHIFSNAMLIVAAVLHGWRLTRWQGQRTCRAPLLTMLHLAYAFIPLGLLTTAVTGPAIGLHLLGIGAIAGMTLAVMMRATMGHTGRDLQAGAQLTAVFSALILAGLIRSFLPNINLFGLSGLWIAAGLWVLAFTGFLVVVGPWLLQPRLTKRQPSKPA